MSAVTQKLDGLGRFDIRLKPTVPRELLNRLEFFTHIIVTPSHVDVDVLGASDLLFPAGNLYPGAGEDTAWEAAWSDSWWGSAGGVYPLRSAIYDAATYAGVIRNLPRGDDFSVGGAGMVFWTGDGEKGPVLEDEVNIGGATFAEAVRAVLPASVTVGTIHAVGGTYTGKHRWQTAREALDYICETFGAEWKVNPDATIDAGTETQLYALNELLHPDSNVYPGTSVFPETIRPTAIAVRDGATDIDLQTLLASRLQHDVDVEDFTTRVLLMAEGAGSQVVVGEADVTEDVDPGFVDFHGNRAQFTRMVFESETATGNADGRARMQLGRFTSARRQITISSSDYRIDGDYTPGRHLWLYDPDAGLFDPTHEVVFDGRPVHPIAVRVMGATWPVTDQMGVYWRDTTGRIVDITEHVAVTEGETTLEVGASRRKLLDRGSVQEALRARLHQEA